MLEIARGFQEAIRMLLTLDPEIYEIVGLSLQVSLSSVFIATCLGIPLGVLIGLFNFIGKRIIIRLTYTLMSLPPVIAGLVVFLFIMRKGPLGSLGLSFTPTAMVIAQVCLVTPIITGLTYNIVKEKAFKVRRLAFTLGANKIESMKLLIFELRWEPLCWLEATLLEKRGS